MTPQEILDKVSLHLLTQNKQSMDDSGESCVYRSPDGLKCAAGILIPDEQYHPVYEGDGWSTLISRYPELDVGSAALVQDLQYIHDGYEVESWPELLSKTADQYGLLVPECVQNALNVGQTV